MSIDVQAEIAKIDREFVSPQARLTKYNELATRVDKERRQAIRLPVTKAANDASTPAYAMILELARALAANDAGLSLPMARLLEQKADPGAEASVLDARAQARAMANPALGLNNAITKVIQDNPELYARHLDEQRRGLGGSRPHAMQETMPNTSAASVSGVAKQDTAPSWDQQRAYWDAHPGSYEAYRKSFRIGA